MEFKQKLAWVIFIGFMCTAPVEGIAQTAPTKIFRKNYSESVSNGRVTIIASQQIDAATTAYIAERYGTTIENIRQQNPTGTLDLCRDENGRYPKSLNPIRLPHERAEGKVWMSCPSDRRGLTILQGKISFTIGADGTSPAPVNSLEEFQQSIVASVKEEVRRSREETKSEVSSFTAVNTENMKQFRADVRAMINEVLHQMPLTQVTVTPEEESLGYKLLALCFVALGIGVLGVALGRYMLKDKNWELRLFLDEAEASSRRQIANLQSQVDGLSSANTALEEERHSLLQSRAENMDDFDYVVRNAATLLSVPIPEDMSTQQAASAVRRYMAQFGEDLQAIPSMRAPVAREEVDQSAVPTIVPPADASSDSHDRDRKLQALRDEFMEMYDELISLPLGISGTDEKIALLGRQIEEAELERQVLEEAMNDEDRKQSEAKIASLKEERVDLVSRFARIRDFLPRFSELCKVLTGVPAEGLPQLPVSALVEVAPLESSMRPISGGAGATTPERATLELLAEQVRGEQGGGADMAAEAHEGEGTENEEADEALPQAAEGEEGDDGEDDPANEEPQRAAEGDQGASQEKPAGSEEGDSAEDGEAKTAAAS